MDTYKAIVEPLIVELDYLYDNGFCDFNLPDDSLCFDDMLTYVNTQLYSQLETKLGDITYSNEAEFRRIVIRTTLDILDDNEFINGDMRVVFESAIKNT
jgi:hypothetical protein